MIHIYCHVTDVGEYSIAVKEDLSDTISPGVYAVNTNKNPTVEFIKAKEAICTAGGSILYFDFRTDNFFTKGGKACIYCRNADCINNRNNESL